MIHSTYIRIDGTHIIQILLLCSMQQPSKAPVSQRHQGSQQRLNFQRRLQNQGWSHLPMHCSPQRHHPEFGSELGMVTLAKELQFAKVICSMSVTESGMVTLVVKDPQSLKAPFPMWVTESGMVKLAKAVQFSKAPSPMRVTELGMVTLAKELQLAKAHLPMLVTVSGMVTLANLRQVAKAHLPMLVTVSGMVTLANLRQVAKAPSLMRSLCRRWSALPRCCIH